MAALLLVGSDASIRIDDHSTRSRRFLQRGLLLSGVIHLSLLFAFLSLTNHGDEELVRIYREPGILLPPPITELRPVPPAPPPSDAATRRNDDGQINPVKETIKKPALPDPKEFWSMLNETHPSARTPADAGNGGETGLTPAPRRDGPFEIRDVDEPPVAIESPKPLYPPFAKDAGITGSVIAKVLVRADGSVARVEVRGASLFLQTTQETLYRWRFRPARFQGRPVSVWLEVPVNFVM